MTIFRIIFEGKIEVYNRQDAEEYAKENTPDGFEAIVEELH